MVHVIFVTGNVNLNMTIMSMIVNYYYWCKMDYEKNSLFLAIKSPVSIHGLFPNIIYLFQTRNLCEYNVSFLNISKRVLKLH